MHSIASDRDVAAAAAGSGEAWAGIVEQHAEALWRKAVDAGLTSADAAQICQLAWLRLGQRLHLFTVMADVVQWLDAEVVREAAAVARRQAARVRTPDNVVRLAPGFAPAPRVETGVRHTISARQLVSHARRPGDASPAQL